MSGGDLGDQLWLCTSLWSLLAGHRTDWNKSELVGSRVSPIVKFRVDESSRRCLKCASDNSELVEVVDTAMSEGAESSVTPRSHRLRIK